MSRSVSLLSGMLVGVMLVLLNYFTSYYVEINFISITVFFIIPAGAMILGFISCAGYGYIAYMQDIRMKTLDIFFLLLIALCSLVLTYFVDYYVNVIMTGFQHEVSFLQYINYMVQGTGYTIHRISTPPLGMFSYFMHFIRILGVCLGGGSVYLCMQALPTCSLCGNYLRTIKKRKIYFVHISELNDYVKKIESKHDAYHELNNSEYSFQSNKIARYIWTLKECKKCNVNTIFGAGEYHHNDWKRIEGSLIEFYN